MATVTPKASTQPEAPRKPPRTGLIILIAVAVIAVVAIGVWAIYEANQTDDAELARATEIMDEWNAAWSNNDPDAAAALFTEDGVYTLTVVNWPFTVEEAEESLRGRDEIQFYIAAHDHRISDVERLSEGTLLADGRIVFPQQFVYQGDRQVALVAIVLDGDLASRLESVWMLDETHEEPDL